MIARPDPRNDPLRELELTAADWMYVPKKVSYSLKAGPHGAVLCNVWYDEIPPEFT